MCIIGVMVFVLICKPVQGQKEEFFFKEFTGSVNRIPPTYKGETKFGFGIGAYHVYMQEKRTNIVFGIEYNKSRIFFRNLYEGRFAHSENITYTMNWLSMPLFVRYNIGENVKFFIELGGHADVMVGAKRKGIMHTNLPGENNQLVHKHYEFNEKTNLNSSGGVSCGIGLRIPVAKYEIIVKPEYKFGLSEVFYSNTTSYYCRYARISAGIRFN